VLVVFRTRTGADPDQAGSRERPVRLLGYALDQRVYFTVRIRSLALVHHGDPFAMDLAGRRDEVRYARESRPAAFRRHSNWRGPAWDAAQLLASRS
jgi:hypothetical protein